MKKLQTLAQQISMVQILAMVIALFAVITTPIANSAPMLPAFEGLVATASELSQPKADADQTGIPGVGRVDYDEFKKTVGDVPGDHPPVINRNNPKVKILDQKAQEYKNTADLIEGDQAAPPEKVRK